MNRTTAQEFLLRVFPEKKAVKEKSGCIDVNSLTAVGENALHYAVIWNEIDSAKALITEGIDLDKKGENGYTPLHEAIEQECTEMVALLLESGANPSIENGLGENAAEMAQEYGFEHIVKLLQQHNK